ncbi:hypothetical protein [Mesorhizobium sp. B2-3-5]|uniref:hypothetical protein n=1 Tax=Mesorhizobium sp. B2-3-5 TaxID=2589958 RepID=UPI0032B1599E
MTVIGQFRDLDRPDMFVWLRGFDSMDARKDALTAFYGGPIWAAHRDAANATMIDSDDVLLLKPAWAGAGLDLSGAERNGSSFGEKPPRNKRLAGLVVIWIHHLRPGRGRFHRPNRGSASSPRDRACDLTGMGSVPRQGRAGFEQADGNLAALADIEIAAWQVSLGKQTIANSRRRRANWPGHRHFSCYGLTMNSVHIPAAK